MQFAQMQQSGPVDVFLAKLTDRRPGAAPAPAAADPLRSVLHSRPSPLRRREEYCPAQLPTDAFVVPSSLPVLAEAAKFATEAPAEAAGLPAVISVRKSRKGCAVVLIRDRATIEIGVKMSVAVVDGVCVEVKRHERKRENEDGETEEELGLFVAWGHRVEARVAITHEGLEAYFNALGVHALPMGLDVVPPFAEACMRFPIRTSLPLELDQSPEVDRAVQERVLQGPFCSQAQVEALWEAKGRLDDLWHIPPPPLARSLMSRVARAQLFPHSGEGGKEHENRAGDKLAELASAVGLMEGVPRGSAFLDLCGGPGAWSQFMFARTDLALRGFGFTLKEGDVGEAGDWQAMDKDQWYPELVSRSDWRALYGANGTGDLLKPGNIEHAARQMAGHKVFLCVADGGFSDKAIPANLLELYFYRLLLGEVLMAASCLAPGGRFVCKLYTALSASTGALLYLVGRLFDSAEIVKPMSSRTTGPERYLSASGFRADAPETKAIIAALQKAHALGNGRSPLTVPLLTPVVSEEELARDPAYMVSARAMASGLCDRQAQALAAVVDRALFLENVAMSVPVPEYERKPVDEEADRERDRERREERQRREERHGGKSYDRSSHDRKERHGGSASYGEKPAWAARHGEKPAEDGWQTKGSGKGKGKGKGKGMGRGRGPRVMRR